MTKILIVEDIPDNVELARKILASRGYEIAHAEDAETGYARALEERPDLILLDLGLPDYDGLTLAGQLREIPAFEDLPIVAFTAWPPETARQMAESYGCNGFIGKPIVKVGEFLEQVEKYLAKE
ncbi:MAG: Polar-differentiation response regulator DivK [Anaerolineales bacterium]|nr:Polar-differentiation response regulator DivK [Anaerolineales bacterium]